MMMIWRRIGSRSSDEQENDEEQVVGKEGGEEEVHDQFHLSYLLFLLIAANRANKAGACNFRFAILTWIRRFIAADKLCLYFIPKLLKAFWSLWHNRHTFVVVIACQHLPPLIISMP
ncbi:unnamed protein product [Onchocerca ochengi]|nr:unnamed protein product [Onchocerca ochengi]